MKKDKKQLLSGLAGAAMLLSGCAAAPAGPQAQPAADPAPASDARPAAGTDAALAPEGPAPNAQAGSASQQQNGYTLTPLASQDIDYIAVPHAQGAFSFDQNVISPSDEAFNLFGTALTGACAKPDFAFEEGPYELGDYYINVSGHMRQSYQVSLKDLEEKEETRIMACTCATGNTTINAEVGGIPLESILQLADLEEGANTITLRGSDGYGIPMPLSYALDRDAMIVYRINGQELPKNQRTQLWMPGAVAKYFTRNIVDIEISREETIPEIAEAGADYRVQVSIQNYADEEAFPPGQPIVFEGYADDYGKAIAAMEVSMDGGETWTSYKTDGATADKWVYWYFTYTPEKTGAYKLMVRAVNEDGLVSPLASTLYFYVNEADGV